jgi:hypothetical protein
MKRGIFFIVLVIALVVAFVYSIMPGSIKSEVEGATIIVPKNNNTIHESNDSIITTTTTTRAPPIEISEETACQINADCGIAYLASCHCDGDDLSATQYIPLCIDGSCVWKSKTDELFCRGREYESSDNSTGQRCVNGFGRCIRNSEVEKFFVLRENVTILQGINKGNYTGGYTGYSFRNNRSGLYSGSSKCYENEYYILDYKKTSGERGQIMVSWNMSAILGSVVIKVGGASQDENGTDNPILWIRKAQKNDTGFF